MLLFPLPLWGKIAIAVLLFFHLLSCSGDLMMLAYMSRYKGREVYTVDDIDNRYNLFSGEKVMSASIQSWIVTGIVAIAFAYAIYKIVKMVQNRNEPPSSCCDCDVDCKLREIKSKRVKK